MKWPVETRGVARFAPGTFPEGTRCSGGPIWDFREGWAVMPFVGRGGMVHYWRRIDLSNRYLSACGVGTALATRQTLIDRGLIHAETGVWPFAPGDYGRCKRCERKMVGR